MDVKQHFNQPTDSVISGKSIKTPGIAVHHAEHRGTVCHGEHRCTPQYNSPNVAVHQAEHRGIVRWYCTVLYAVHLAGHRDSPCRISRCTSPNIAVYHAEQRGTPRQTSQYTVPSIALHLAKYIAVHHAEHRGILRRVSRYTTGIILVQYAEHCGTLVVF